MLTNFYCTFIFLTMQLVNLIIIVFLLSIPLIVAQAPIKFCRTQSKTGSFMNVDVYMQDGFTWWQEWVNARGGIQVPSQSLMNATPFDLLKRY